MIDTFTFSCHACGAERPENQIAVFTRVRSIRDSGGASFSENIRYCNDDPNCFLAAQKVSFLDAPGFVPPASPIVTPLPVKRTLKQKIRHVFRPAR